MGVWGLSFCWSYLYQPIFAGYEQSCSAVTACFNASAPFSEAVTRRSASTAPCAVSVRCSIVSSVLPSVFGSANDCIRHWSMILNGIGCASLTCVGRRCSARIIYAED